MAGALYTRNIKHVKTDTIILKLSALLNFSARDQCFFVSWSAERTVESIIGPCSRNLHHGRQSPLNETQEKSEKGKAHTWFQDYRSRITGIV